CGQAEDRRLRPRQVGDAVDDLDAAEGGWLCHDRIAADDAGQFQIGGCLHGSDRVLANVAVTDDGDLQFTHTSSLPPVGGASLSVRPLSRPIIPRSGAEPGKPRYNTVEQVDQPLKNS